MQSKKIIKFLIISFSPILFFNLYSLAEFEKASKKKETNYRKTIKWEKLDIRTLNEKYTSEEIIWNKFGKDDQVDKNKITISSPSRNVENKNDRFFKFTSLNRSIVIDEKIGPDISFLVPIGFKSTTNKRFDFSLRGWNRRPQNSQLFAWNGGDAVANVYYQLLNNEKSSFDLNFGFRSVYKGNLSGGSSPIGEGVSLGFKWAYNLDRNKSIAFGAEQFIQFDNKTDTGRDIYFTTSKVWGNNILKNQFPLIVTTFGIGTGYLALWDKTKFACSDLFGGAAVNVKKYHELCWGPFGTLSMLINKNHSVFFEYNNYSFMVGSSLSYRDKYRLTLGLTIAESYDDYNIKDFDEMRWFSRVSIGF